MAVAASTAVELVDRVTHALRENSLIEVRLDSLTDPALPLPGLQSLLRNNPQAMLIATCRRTLAGGNFAGSLAQELAVLAEAAAVGCAMVDLAVESAEEAAPDQLQAFRASLAEAGAALIVSSHDFEQTGDLDRLEQALARLARHRPDLAKIVSTANSLADNLPMLRLLGQKRDTPVVGIAMGEAGVMSRVLGVRAGGLFTFASTGEGAETAAGQLAAKTLRDLYRLEQMADETRVCRVYGVAGSPIWQSLSPLMHNTAFRTLGLDAVYLPLLSASAGDLMRLARELPLDGISITMPLKQAVLSHLDWIDPLAARVGACNTVVRTPDGEYHGYNSDVAAITGPLEKRLGLRGARVLVLGAGGAARAAVFGLCDQGAEVWLSNRTRAAAELLVAEAGANAHLAEPAMLSSAGSGASFDVLVNATPAGMQQPGGSGDQAEVDGQQRDQPLCARLIFDMVYSPLETPLLRRARAQGLSVIAGVEMFVHQGARQFELWTGFPAPEQEMLRVVIEALRTREQAVAR